MKNRMLITFALGLTHLLALSTALQAQIANPYPLMTKQVAAPLPKLALMGAVGETRSGVQYNKVILTITNSDKYDSQMFVLPSGVKLPPNPCAGSRARIVAAVYAEAGKQYASCIPMPRPGSLSEFSFLIEKGKPVPPYVFAVLTDLKTGAAYRSNLISPSTGLTK